MYDTYTYFAKYSKRKRGGDSQARTKGQCTNRDTFSRPKAPLCTSCILSIYPTTCMALYIPMQVPGWQAAGELYDHTRRDRCDHSGGL